MSNTMSYWNKTDALYLADGKLYTPEEVIAKFPFAGSMPTILTKSLGQVLAIDSLPILVTVYNVDTDQTEDEMLAEIERAIRRAQNPTYSDVEEALMMLKGEIE